MTSDFEKEIDDLLERQHGIIKEDEPISAELVQRDPKPKNVRGDEKTIGLMLGITGCGLPLILLVGLVMGILVMLFMFLSAFMF